ncbi:MAG: serine/threonine protein kinase [Anaerolineales bacterium]|nr:serine/threonine protein kinase [Anaerolineales bacterium]
MLNNRYQLRQALGEGGMAEVYVAEDLRLGREVAVKLLRPQYASDKTFLERFIYEARAMAGFNHPNVVNVFDVGRDGSAHYIVMEYIDGQDLRTLLRRAERLSVRQSLDVARQMARGIGYAHRKGLVHRDIKPGNILIDRRGTVKVADFGIAKALAGAGMTEPGVVWGTTAYLSPEQVSGRGASPASDVYAIGIVLYEMLTGHPPFEGEDRVAVALKHLHEEPPPIPAALEVPAPVQQLLAFALRKAPEERFATAESMATAIGEVATMGTLPTMALPAIERAPLLEHTTPERTTRRAPDGDPYTNGPPSVDLPLGPDWPSIIMAVVIILLTLGLFPLYSRVFELIG